MGKDFNQNNNRGGGGNRGGPPRGGRGGRGGRGRPMDQGPPSFVVPYATYMHRSENCFVVKCTDPTRVPKFNRGVYLDTKAKVGTIDEILGPVNSFYFSVKPADGVSPDGFKTGHVFYMSPDDLLPMDRFTQKRAPGPRNAGGRPGGNKGGPGGKFGGPKGGPKFGGGVQKFGGPKGGNFNKGGNFKSKPIQKR